LSCACCRATFYIEGTSFEGLGTHVGVFSNTIQWRVDGCILGNWFRRVPSRQAGGRQGNGDRKERNGNMGPHHDLDHANSENSEKQARLLRVLKYLS